MSNKPKKITKKQIRESILEILRAVGEEQISTPQIHSSITGCYETSSFPKGLSMYVGKCPMTRIDYEGSWISGYGKNEKRTPVFHLHGVSINRVRSMLKTLHKENLINRHRKTHYTGSAEWSIKTDRQLKKEDVKKNIKTDCEVVLQQVMDLTGMNSGSTYVGTKFDPETFTRSPQGRVTLSLEQVQSLLAMIK